MCEIQIPEKISHVTISRATVEKGLNHRRFVKRNPDGHPDAVEANVLLDSFGLKVVTAGNAEQTTSDSEQTKAHESRTVWGESGQHDDRNRCPCYQPGDPLKLMGITQVADLEGVSIDTIRRWINDGRLEAKGAGKGRKVRLAR